MKTKPGTFVVIGSGSWGTALAILLSTNQHEVQLWGNNPEQLEVMQQKRQNSFFLKGIDFPENLMICNDLEKVLKTASNVLIAVPSEAIHEVTAKIKPWISKNISIISATKGLYEGEQCFVHVIIANTLGAITSNIAVISGPTFATEVAMGLPTAVSIAAEKIETAQQIARFFHSERFRTYTCQDIIGVQVGGAVKNVLAIASGIADGLGFGANTRAAIITRGLNEMLLLGVKLGGKKDTFMGLSGFGDLVLTCTDNQSRNRRLGIALAQGDDLKTATAKIGQAVEGIRTAKTVHHLAQSLGIEMPISTQTYQVLYQNKKPKDAVNDLLSREPKTE
ncbi:MAG: NAD(P)-dependent glycerol-3-phosphate dehydrogenase [Methylococcales bacterium]|nr:NAD(P)-dependent glycerol-3-phosphate dehydrogenase [Methylococcales bacterium]